MAAGLQAGKWAGRTPALLATVSRRDHPPILTGARDAIEHAPGGSRNFADGFFSVALTAQVGRHHAENVRSLLNKDHTRIVAHAFKGARFVGDFQVVREVAWNPAIFVRSEHFEEVVGHFLI